MEQAGVNLVAQGAAAFGADLKGAEKAVDSFGAASAEAAKKTDLWQDAAGRWRTASGRFASDAEKAAAGVEKIGPAATTAADKTTHAGSRIDAAGQVMIGALRKVGEIAVEAFGQALRAGAAFIGDSIELAGEFEQTMSVLGAVSGATGKELDAVAAKAKDLGADLSLPATSAVDAGEAMLELAKAGFTTQQAMDAAKGTLQLAAAAQIDEAKAAEISSNAINAFNLEAKDALFVSDLLAASANASSVEITDVAQSYQMAGAIFANFQGPVVGAKESLVDLTTAISILGNAGIKGSDAGTSLKQSLLQLTGPSQVAKDQMKALMFAAMDASNGMGGLDNALTGNAKERGAALNAMAAANPEIARMGDIAYDGAGKMRPFNEIIRLTAQATAGMTDEMRNQAITSIFGADAARAILVLMKEGPAVWDAMSTAVTRQGAAADLAKAQTAGYKGALEGAKSQIETLQLTIGQYLTPILADLLNNYISPGIAAFTSWADSILSASDPVRALVKSIDKAVPGFEQIVNIVSDVISSFSKGGAAANDLGGAVDDLSGIWQKAMNVVSNVMNGYKAIADAILPIVASFVEQHGDEISTFFKQTYDQIIRIVNLALDLYNAVVPKVLGDAARWIENHATGIQAVLGGAWDVISGTVSAALQLIEGTIRIALDVIRGDWEGAWTDLQTMSAGFVQSLGQVIEGFLNIIAGLFNTNLAEIGALWSHNWNEIVKYVTNINWGDVGWSVVRGIISGLTNNWGSLSGWLTEKMRGLVDAAMSAIGASSPAKEFMPVGQFAIQGLMAGAEAMIPSLTSLIDQIATSMIEGLRKNRQQMSDQIRDTAKDLIEQARSLAEDINAAIADGFSSTASIDRQLARNLDSLKDVLPQYQSYTQGALLQAEQAARQFLDPTQGAQYFKMRSDQILEYANLQRQLAEAETRADKDRIRRQMELINAAQNAEIGAFSTGQQGQVSPSQAIAEAFQNILSNPSIKLPGILDNPIIAQLSSLISQLQQPAANQWASPPMSSAQMAYGGNSTSYSSQRTYNMPVYTNQSPAALQQSMAIVEAMYP